MIRTLGWIPAMAGAGLIAGAGVASSLRADSPGAAPGAASRTVDADPVAALRDWLARPAAERPALTEQSFAGEPLTKSQAAEAIDLLWTDRLAQLTVERKAEWDAKSITTPRSGDKVMKFEHRLFGEPPASGRSMFISMHGGGGAPHDVNEQQWKNQIGLYRPPEGIYIAPRAPTDNWNLWHEGHIDPMFDRLIEDAIVFEHVDPDRIYLMGYSAGGDGVYQLAPRMADRFAAAAMMAGHPNDASPLGLRNLPFIIQVGADDAAYDRNKVAAEWGKKLDELHEKDPGGYIHETHLREGMGHWMKREDAMAIPWMMKYARNPLPDRVVWRQGHTPQPRLYWLAAPADQRSAGAMVTVSRAGQVFTVEAVENIKTFTILLNDDIAELSTPLVVQQGNHDIVRGTVHRTIATIFESLDTRADSRLVFSAGVDVNLDAPGPAKEHNADAALLRQEWPILMEEPIKPMLDADRFESGMRGW